MGRRKLYRPAILSIHDFQGYTQILNAVQKRCAAAHAAYVDYKLFASLNGLNPEEPTTLAKFCAALQSANVDPGTICTRIDYITDELKREKAGGLTWHLISKHFELV